MHGLVNGRWRLTALALSGVLLFAPAAPAAADASALSGASSASSADPTSLPGLAQTDSNIQQDGCRKPSTAVSDRVPWAQAYLRPDLVWPLTEGAGVTVAVVGSGVQDTAGVLGGRLTLGARAWGSTTSGQDCIGQGTFVADLIAAARRSGTGFAGIAPAAKVLAVGVTDQTGITIGDVLATGIRTAVDGGARVVDVAVPVQAGTSALAEAVAYATSKGALIVAPDAFDGGGQASNQSPVYPAAYPGVLSVADLAPGGTTPQGSTPVQRVDLAAPGDQVMSLGPGGAGYFTASGPSYAAALVAGTAALVLGSQPQLTVAQLRSRLESTAYHPGTALPDPQVGYGTVDPVAAVTDVLPGEAGATASPGASRTRADVMTRPVVVDNSRAEDPALTVGAGALVVVLVAGALGLVLPRARRRGWRTGPVPPGTAASAREV